MAWTTLSLIGLLLIGGVGALLWQRHRARWLALGRRHYLEVHLRGEVYHDTAS